MGPIGRARKKYSSDMRSGVVVKRIVRVHENLGTCVRTHGFLHITILLLLLLLLPLLLLLHIPFFFFGRTDRHDRSAPVSKVGDMDRRPWLVCLFVRFRP